MQVAYRGVSNSRTSSSTENNIELCYRGVRYYPDSIKASERAISDYPEFASIKNNIEFSYRGVRYYHTSSKAVGEVTRQKLCYRGITYYCEK